MFNPICLIEVNNLHACNIPEAPIITDNLTTGVDRADRLCILLRIWECNPIQYKKIVQTIISLEPTGSRCLGRHKCLQIQS